MVIVENDQPLPTVCEDTWHWNCSDFVWACRDPRFPWFKEACSKTCGICTGNGRDDKICNRKTNLVILRLYIPTKKLTLFFVLKNVIY